MFTSNNDDNEVMKLWWHECHDKIVKACHSVAREEEEGRGRGKKSEGGKKLKGDKSDFSLFFWKSMQWRRKKRVEVARSHKLKQFI